ncbi:hypothetical protein SGRIM128S_02212 [Streptomyces griseomycini]
MTCLAPSAGLDRGRRLGPARTPALLATEPRTARTRRTSDDRARSTSSHVRALEGRDSRRSLAGRPRPPREQAPPDHRPATERPLAVSGDRRKPSRRHPARAPAGRDPLASVGLVRRRRHRPPRLFADRGRDTCRRLLRVRGIASWHRTEDRPQGHRPRIRPGRTRQAVEPTFARLRPAPPAPSARGPRQVAPRREVRTGLCQRVAPGGGEPGCRLPGTTIRTVGFPSAVVRCGAWRASPGRAGGWHLSLDRGAAHRGGTGETASRCRAVRRPEFGVLPVSAPAGRGPAGCGAARSCSSVNPFVSTYDGSCVSNDCATCENCWLPRVHFRRRPRPASLMTH